MKYAAVLLLAAAVACAPVPTNTPPPTVTPVLTVTVTASIVPIVTITPVIVPSATIQPTNEPPVRIIHPVARAVGTINVLASWCAAQSTTWLVWDYGMLQTFDEVGNADCVARGVVAS